MKNITNLIFFLVLIAIAQSNDYGKEFRFLDPSDVSEYDENENIKSAEIYLEKKHPEYKNLKPEGIIHDQMLDLSSSTVTSQDIIFEAQDASGQNVQINYYQDNVDELETHNVTLTESDFSDFVEKSLVVNASYEVALQEGIAKINDIVELEGHTWSPKKIEKIHEVFSSEDNEETLWSIFLSVQDSKGDVENVKLRGLIVNETLVKIFDKVIKPHAEHLDSTE